MCRLCVRVCQVFELSAKAGDGMDEYLNFLAARLDELHTAAAS